MTDRAGECEVRLWVDLVYAAARRQMRGVGNEAGVEDVVQAVFLVMAKKRAEGKLPAEGNTAGWLIRVTQYAVKEAKRREVRRGYHEKQAAMAAGAREEGRMEDDKIAAKLDAALLKLGRVDREVVVRRYLHGEAVREVGAALGMSENTTGQRIRRAVEKLRRVLGGQGVVVPAEMMVGAMVRELGIKAPAVMVAKAGGSSAAASEIANGLLRSVQMVKVWTGVAVGAAVVGVALVAMASGRSAPELPKVSARGVAVTALVGNGAAAGTRPDVAVLDKAWESMAGAEPGATRGMLAFAGQREAAVAFLRGRLQPLTISAEEVRKLVGDLGSADEGVWKAAMEKLQYFDPRLAIPMTTLMDKVKEEPARRRLVSVLSDREITAAYGEDPIELQKFKGGMNFATKQTKSGGVSWWAEEQVGRLGSAGMTPKKKWAQAGRGIAALGAIGTPEALAIVKAMATGNAEAEPTKAAKVTLELVAAAAMQPAEGQLAMEEWWVDMAKEGPASWRGELALAQRPAEATTFFKTKLVPLKISADEVEALVEKLASENEAEWKGAAAKMAYFDPRLAVDVKRLMEEAVDPVQNARLVEVLLDAPQGSATGHTFKFMKSGKDNYGLMDVTEKSTTGVAWKVSQIDAYGGWTHKTQWRRAARAEVVLGTFGTAEAKGILAAMATGHPEAEPTMVAVEEVGEEKMTGEHRGGSPVVVQ